MMVNVSRVDEDAGASGVVTAPAGADGSTVGIVAMAAGEAAG
jgi:hypothetical protein